MVHYQQHLLALGLSAALAASPAAGQRFFPDDPLQAVPETQQVKEAKSRKIDALFDFFYQSFRSREFERHPSEGVNTLGEVPDSSWFTNRHAKKRLSRAELQAGPMMSGAPVAPFTISGAKTEGITPGFQMRDANKQLFFVKPDPASDPEMATAADMIGPRFFYAIGYNTPANYLIWVRPDELKISPEAEVTGAAGRKRPMTPKDLIKIMANVAREPDGRIRLLASRGLEGKPLGPFRYEGTRTDDPNDIVPHERRRDLRGLRLFCAWLNHTDAKSGNSLDTLVEANGLRRIRHHLIDFGAALGSDSDRAKDARLGHEYIFPRKDDAAVRMLTFGFYFAPWETVDYPRSRGAGRFSSQGFNPEEWKPNYPNPAFLQQEPGDEFWAAKIIMSFTDDDIRAVVETGAYSDPKTTDHITRTLIERRDIIGRAYFSKVLPLDGFSVDGGGELRFENLAASHGFGQAPQYVASWSRFDNKTAAITDLRLPDEAMNSAPGSIYAVRIHASGDEKKAVQVFVRRAATGWEVVGIERFSP